MSMKLTGKLKINFKIFGIRVAFRFHQKKSEIFGRHYHWSGRLQTFFWKRGFSIHNFILDECTQDFSCCSWPGDKYAGFLEQLVAVASDAEKGKHTGVMHIKKKDTKL